MKNGLADPRKRHCLIAAAILAAGLVSGVVIYLRASEATALPMEFSPTTSKQYRHDLEVFGGTANVLAAQFMDWFKGLWHGTNLAFTVAVISAAISLGYLFFAVVLPQADADPAEPDDEGSPRGP